MLATIADRCGCKISDVILGNNIKLCKAYESANASVVLFRNRGVRTFKTSHALIAELEKLEKSGLLKNLSHACRLLDVNVNCIKTLAPDFSAMLVQRGQKLRRAEKLARNENGFDEYWKYFQELRREGIRPSKAKVAERIFQRTGVRRNFVYSAFHTRALRTANVKSVHQLDRDPKKHLPKNRGRSKTSNPCRKRH
jgi:hypothetical protein